jgi:hypothetical protein
MDALRPRLRIAGAVALASALALACAGTGAPQQSGYRFFADADPSGDPWYAKVEQWQERERQDRPGEQLADADAIRAAGPSSGLLTVKMGRWESQERMAMARRISEWAQTESRRHYRFDPPTSQADDPWPTTKDLLDTNGDDCDGLDLISYKLMRHFGFPPDQLYRAIVRRDRDGANHMVTLWFEDGADPWVVDSTGAVTRRVRRFSDLPGWTPTKVFNEQVQYTPRRLKAMRALAQAE